MFDVENHMLPKTATPLAKAMDILEERLFALPVEMITKDPYLVDASLLDHLAWEHSVDTWDANWPEEIKRRFIAASAEVHRYKGTPYGIKEALSLLGVEVELLEWWQEGGSGVPGTFEVQSFVTEISFGADLPGLIASMRSVLNRVSPVSRGWALKTWIKETCETNVGAFARVGGVFQTLPLIPHDQHQKARITVAAASGRGGVHRTTGLEAG